MTSSNALITVLFSVARRVSYPTIVNLRVVPDLLSGLYVITLDVRTHFVLHIKGKHDFTHVMSNIS